MRAMELLTAPARRWAQGKRRGEQLTLVADAVDPAQDSATIATNTATIPDAQSNQPGEWTLAQRIAFRFAFVYFIVYSFPYPLSLIPRADRLFEPYRKLGPIIIPWVAKRILHLSQEMVTTPNGSGDRAYNYVQLLCCFAFSLVAALVWSIVDRHRMRYDKLFALLRVYVRYVLACTMLSYGIIKVFRMQFGDPLPTRLLQSYGDSSPMGLLWTFMGYSAPYTIFSGLAETIGGWFLFVRRTAPLGALVLIAVLTNIVMLNFSYDVPVKIYSSNLLLMSIFIIAPDLRRLANVLVLNRPAKAVPLRSPLPSRWMEYSRAGVKILFIGFVLLTTVNRSLERRRQYADELTPKVPLYGYWEVEELIKNREPVPMIAANPKAWRRVGVNNREMFSIRLMDSSFEQYKMEYDATKKMITLAKGDDQYTLAVDPPDPDHLIIEGVLKGDSIRVRLRRIDASKFLLVNRGFHWINEVPFNR